MVGTIATPSAFPISPSLAKKSSGVKPAIQRKCICDGNAEAGGECAECQAKEQMIQRQATNNDFPAFLPPSVAEAMQSGSGDPLAKPARLQMENALGADLGDVRVHTESQAARAARDLNAEAFTFGQDIFFGAGTFQPEKPEGQKLLAHELTHTVQQKGNDSLQANSAGGVTISQPGEPQEVEAEAVAQRVMMGKPPALQLSPAAHLQRQPTDADVADASTQAEVAEPGLSPEVARRLTYATAVLNRVSPLPEDDKQILGNIIGGYGIYEKIQLRDMKRSELEGIRSLLDNYRGYDDDFDVENSRQLVEGEIQNYYRGHNDGSDPGDAGVQDIPGGTPVTSEQVQFLEVQLEVLPPIIARLDEEIQAELSAMGITEGQLRSYITDDFPRIWERRAKQIAYTMLDLNEEAARAEQERYAVQVCSPDIEGLLAADRRLAILTDPYTIIDRKIQELNQRIERAQQEQEEVASGRPLPAGIPPSPEEVQNMQAELDQLKQEREAIQEELRQTRHDFAQERAEFGREYPILLHPHYRPGSFINAAPEDLHQVAGGLIGEILQNIKDTRDNIRDEEIYVWDLNDIPQLTNQELGVAEDSALGRAVRAYARDKESDDSWLDIALTALSIVGALVATFATGGLALAGLLVGVAAGGASLYRSARKYGAESDAELVALDPVIADISAHEPELLWVVLDVVGLVFDAGDVIRLLRPAARAVMASGDIARFADEAYQYAPQATERLINSARFQASRRAGQTARETVNQAEIVGHSARKLSDDLSPGELDAELRHVSRSEMRRIEDGSEYIREVNLPPPGNHRWKLRRDGIWCRFSNGGRCLIPGQVPPALRELTEDITHQYAQLIPAARVAEVSAQLTRSFPELERLSPGALERVVRAAYALAEGGGLRQANRWLPRARGQLLEEIASARIRGLISTRAGRETLGLGDITDELVFFEGSRIRDIEGALLTDGIIGIRRGEHLEIVAVVESKAGSFAAGGLTESLTSLKRASTSEIIEGLFALSSRSSRGLMAKIAQSDPALHQAITVCYANIEENAARLAQIRDRLMAHLERLPKDDLRQLKQLVTRGEGQISRDVERLMEADDRTVRLLIDDAEVTGSLPRRPAFLGVAPSDVAMDDITQQLQNQGFRFGMLDLGDSAQTRQQLDRMAEALVRELGPDLERAAATAAP
jgi:hypothetical protein